MILQSRKSSKVVRVNVTDQITSIRETAGMQGAPTIDVTLNDPEWLVSNADILDLDVDGRLDHVETKHGDDWYRLVKIAPRNEDLTLQFEHRVVAILRQYKKPKKHRRVAGYTRAMFLKSLVQEARDDGNKIEFYSPRLHERQRIAKGKVPRGNEDSTGEKGISKKQAQSLAVKGKKATKSQVKIGETSLSVADKLLADASSGIRARVNIALVEALITESSMTNLKGGDRDSGGVLQVRRGVHANVTVTDVEQVVTLFLTKGYSGRGSAIHLANTTTMRPHEIAQAVQGSAFSDGSNYKAHEAEAKEWVKAFHVITDPNELSEDVTVDSAYYFTRGQAGQTEDSWEAMNRNAGEVNWRVFVRGNKVYYLSDNDLYKQKPRFTFSRSSPRVIDVAFDWDEGKKVNEANLTVQRQDVKHGTTVELTGAGPASTRWLVWEVQRERTGGFSTLQLRTPQTAKAEPSPSQQSVTVEGNASTRKGDAFDVLIRSMRAVDKNTPGYLYGGGHGKSLDSLTSRTSFDCSSSVSWVLHKAGLFDHDTAWVSGDFAARFGKPGKGKMFTVWANANHVWIEIHKGAFAGGRFDTGGPGGGMGARLWTGALPRSSSGFTARHYEGM